MTRSEQGDITSVNLHKVFILLLLFYPTHTSTLFLLLPFVAEETLERQGDKMFCEMWKFVKSRSLSIEVIFQTDQKTDILTRVYFPQDPNVGILSVNNTKRKTVQQCAHHNSEISVVKKILVVAKEYEN